MSDSSSTTRLTLLGKLISCNMNITTDNTIPIISSNCMITAIYVTNSSGSLTTAAGGVYTAVTKGGTAIVSSAQAYSTLTGATIWLALTMAASPIKIIANQVFLNLTTAQGSAMTADVYCFGVDLTLV